MQHVDANERNPGKNDYKCRVRWFQQLSHNWLIIDDKRVSSLMKYVVLRCLTFVPAWRRQFVSWWLLYMIKCILPIKFSGISSSNYYSSLPKQLGRSINFASINSKFQDSAHNGKGPSGSANKENSKDQKSSRSRWVPARPFSYLAIYFRAVNLSQHLTWVHGNGLRISSWHSGTP